MATQKYTTAADGQVYKTNSVNMKKRILTGWSVRRVLYLILGVIVVVQGIMDKEWIWLLPGLYFTAMGVFAFGCASGNCYGGQCYVDPKTTPKKS